MSSEGVGQGNANATTRKLIVPFGVHRLQEADDLFGLFLSQNRELK
ncbi:hypothetical protein HMPREF0185_02151 [Brevundimonas diminuta 470-4]|nr:hypothetical protein HMPREF0185_02151 [Brevundimonas diminuta 470-4]